MRRQLAKLIGFMPSQLEHYRQAFTHKSAIPLRSPKQSSNERLEYLGDAVLSLVIGDYLYHKYPDKDEGQLSQLRARVVNRELFNELGFKMKLDEWMRQIAPYKADTESSPALLGNAFEALVGAIFLDKGYKRAKLFFEKTVLVYHLDIEEVNSSDTNYKSRLLEWAQKNGRRVEFVLLNTSRDGNKNFFEVDVEVDGEKLGTACETKKKKSEQMASKAALEKLNLLDMEEGL